jgi:hypothetical protein
MTNQNLSNTQTDESQAGYCIYINTLLHGATPSLRTDNGNLFVFQSRKEAEREIAENMMTKLQEYMDGQREFDDAVTLEEYVVDVTVQPDGSVTDKNGNLLGRIPDLNGL